jgi:hypothetical protein
MDSRAGNISLIRVKPTLTMNLDHSALVRFVSRQRINQVAKSADYELLSNASMGLAETTLAYDPSNGCSRAVGQLRKSLVPVDIDPVHIHFRTLFRRVAFNLTPYPQATTGHTGTLDKLRTAPLFVAINALVEPHRIAQPNHIVGGRQARQRRFHARKEAIIGRTHHVVGPTFGAR